MNNLYVNVLNRIYLYSRTCRLCQMSKIFAYTYWFWWFFPFERYAEKYCQFESIKSCFIHSLFNVKYNWVSCFMLHILLKCSLDTWSIYYFFRFKSRSSWSHDSISSSSKNKLINQRLEVVQNNCNQFQFHIKK